MVHQFEASLTFYHLKNLFGFLYRLFNFILLLRIPSNSTYIKLSYYFLVVTEQELFLYLVALVEDVAQVGGVHLHVVGVVFVDRGDGAQADVEDAGVAGFARVAGVRGAQLVLRV